MAKTPIKIDISIINYFHMVMDLDNEPSRDVFINEFKEELEKSLGREIKFTDKSK